MAKRKIYGMSLKDWKTLGKILNPTLSECDNKIPTVAEYIEAHPDVKTERRISKKGTELIKVYYPTGKVTEYPVQHINNTAAFEY